MTRFIQTLAVAALLVPMSGAGAQTASSETHEVGPGDSLYAIVAVHYPERMARWTDVAADLVALNPESFPNGMDTVLKLGDVLVLVDYSSPQSDGTTPGAGTADSASVPGPGSDSYASPGATLDRDNSDVAARSVNPSQRRDVAPTASGNDTTPASAVDSVTDPADAVSSTADVLPGGVIGVVASAEGRVLATDHKNQQRALAVGDRVLFGDAVFTADNASATVRMLDDAEFLIQPGSRLMFERYQYDTATKKGRAVLTLVKGGMRGVSGLLGQYRPQAMTINTAVATVDVRDTEFALRVCAGDTCRTTQDGDPLDPGLYSGVLEGTIVLSNNTGDVENQRGGFFHIAAPNRVPETAPAAALLLFSKQELAQLDVDVEEEQPLSFLGWLKRKLFGD